MMTVVVLLVLWMIVIVPMVLQRHDERSRERTVSSFRRVMHALGRRAPAADVFVASGRRAEAPQPPGLRPPPLPTRRPVPAAQEALMHPVDKTELSAARAAMMARRRRSLTVLGIGAVIFTALGLLLGGLLWAPAVVFLAGLGGYLLFLRTQATRDRQRRALRLQRSYRDRPAEVPSYEATATPTPRAPRIARDPVVRLDDDDLELQSMDTIDLTGVYTEDLGEQHAVRRAS